MQPSFENAVGQQDISLRLFTGRNIFLSYRSRDEPQVHGLRTLLGCLGNKVTKMGEFPPGQWGPHIYRSLAEADTLLIYLSKEPSRPPILVHIEDLSRRVRKWWNKVVLRRGKVPDDWMREEFEHFRTLHGDSRDIIIYAEADAERPGHLRDYQVHYFANQLTELRKKWNDLRRQKIHLRDARKVIIDDLKKCGVNLDDGAKEVFFDLFGINGVRSAARYVRIRVYTAFRQLYLFGITGVALALAMGLGFSIPRLDIISVPDITQVTIELGQSGRVACENAGLVCVSATQKRVATGPVDAGAFYGYATPTCESRVERTSECREIPLDYRLTNVAFKPSAGRESDADPSVYSYLCLQEPRYEFANCVAPLGD